MVYFANVAHAALDSRAGILRVQTVYGNIFILEQRKFPTSARKPEKIAINTAAKFTKVSNKILEGIRQASPDAVITYPRG